MRKCNTTIRKTAGKQLILKISILILLSLLFIPALSSAQTTCQVSTDNATWQEVSDYGGFVNETTNITYIPYLNESTLYYFRCKNPTSDWGYTYHRTKTSGEVGMSSWSITFFMIVITAV